MTQNRPHHVNESSVEPFGKPILSYTVRNSLLMLNTMTFKLFEESIGSVLIIVDYEYWTQETLTCGDRFIDSISLILHILEPVHKHFEHLVLGFEHK